MVSRLSPEGVSERLADLDGWSVREERLQIAKTRRSAKKDTRLRRFRDNLHPNLS